MNRLLQYRFTGEDLGSPRSIGDDGDAWWAGVYQVGVGLVLAAGLASTALAAQIQQQTLSYDEQIPSGLHGQPPEDYWVDPVAPLSLTFLVPAPWSYEQNENAAGLYGVPHEDYWVDTSLRPTPLAFLAPEPWAYEQNEAPPQVGFDEGIWVDSVRPSPLAFIAPDPWAFDVQEPSGSLYGVPEEIYWLNGTILPSPPPVALYFIGREQWEYDAESGGVPLPPIPATLPPECRLSIGIRLQIG